MSQIQKKTDYFDISPEISSLTAVFPVDTSFSRKETLSFSEGHHLNLSKMTSTLHIGAHADAPSHYHENGQSIEKRDLLLYMGPCQLITINKKRGERIMLADVKTEIQAPRVLFKTNSFPDPNQWENDFNSLDPALIKKFHTKGVRLLGIDTPSVDPFDDKNLLAHKAIYETNMAILEGLLLQNVPEGFYNLIALPLRIKGADASPVRAILIPWEKE